MKIAIITGATSGMGSEMVKHAIGQELIYDEVWILGRRTERLQSFEQRYPGVRFRSFPVDLTSGQQMEEFQRTLDGETPEVILFVHAAGFGIMGMIDEISGPEQEEMVDVNVRACVSLTNYVLPYMARHGHMIYFASSAAFLPQPGFAVYAASKAFVLSYVRALRAENRHRDLRITAVCPGAVKTEFFRRAANDHPLPAYKKLVMADAGRVVKKAWKDNQRNKEISVYGPLMKLFYAAAKILPHSVFLRFMGRHKFG